MQYNTYNVSKTTCIINRIKSNNRAVELLEAIDKAMTELYYDSTAKIIYPDEEGNFTEVNTDTRDRDFYNEICEWITKNHNHMVADSMEQYAQIKK